MSDNSGKLKTFLTITAACVGAVLLVLATAVACIEGVAFDRGFYEREYAKLNTAQYVGVDSETLNEATDVLLGYLQGDVDSLDMQAEVSGAQREYYNTREKDHMADVATLNQNAVFFMQLAYPLGALLVLVACILCKRRIYMVLKSCFYSIVGVLAFFGVLAVWAGFDFNSFWITFHHVFFTNDLWLLDPATSLLIRMYEQQFFFDMVSLILVLFIGLIVASLVMLWIGYKRMEKKWANA